jgi:hypothetical protein
MKDGGAGGDLRRFAQSAFRRALRLAKYAVGHDPRMMPLYLRITPLGLSRQITASTQLVVEGFPRCGNTFTVCALLDACDNRLRIVSHAHVPGQVKLAIAKGVPTVLQVREPIGALVSYLAYDPRCLASHALKEYIYYHRQLVPYISDLVVIDFEQTTIDMNAVIDQLNDSFGLAIPPFDHSEANVARIFDQIDTRHGLVHRNGNQAIGVPRPTLARAELRNCYTAMLREPKNADLLAAATDLYDLFASRATTTKTGTSNGDAEIVALAETDDVIPLRRQHPPAV